MNIYVILLMCIAVAIVYSESDQHSERVLKKVNNTLIIK